MTLMASKTVCKRPRLPRHQWPRTESTARPQDITDLNPKILASTPPTTSLCLLPSPKRTPATLWPTAISPRPVSSNPITWILCEILSSSPSMTMIRVKVQVWIGIMPFTTMLLLWIIVTPTHPMGIVGRMGCLLAAGGMQIMALIWPTIGNIEARPLNCTRSLCKRRSKMVRIIKILSGNYEKEMNKKRDDFFY